MRRLSGGGRMNILHNTTYSQTSIVIVEFDSSEINRSATPHIAHCDTNNMRARGARNNNKRIYLTTPSTNIIYKMCVMLRVLFIRALMWHACASTHNLYTVCLFYFSSVFSICSCYLQSDKIAHTFCFSHGMRQ